MSTLSEKSPRFATPSVASSIIAPTFFGHRGGDTLICFSHLRWKFVFQRPQHLMTRFAASKQVIVWEEPTAAETGAAASLDLMRLVISPVLASSNPRLEAQTVALAAGFGLSSGASMTALGEFHGVCKAAISARVRGWAGRLGIRLTLPRDCKENTANYRLFNRTKFGQSTKL